MALAVAHAIDLGIVKQNRDTIPGDVDVALEDLRPVVESGREGGERVLGVGARGAAMSDHDRTRDVEVGMRHGRRVT